MTGDSFLCMLWREVITMTLRQYAYHSAVVKCPNCRHRVERVNLQAGNLGSPLSRCPYCQEIVYNPYVKEPALVIYEDKGGDPNIWSVLNTILFNTLFIVLLKPILQAGRLTAPAWVALILCGGLALLFDVGWVRLFKVRRHLEEYHQKQMDRLEGRAGEQSEELRESLRRLSQKKYLDELEKYGVEVPEYFYHRIGIKEKKA